MDVVILASLYSFCNLSSVFFLSIFILKPSSYFTFCNYFSFFLIFSSSFFVISPALVILSFLKIMCLIIFPSTNLSFFLSKKVKKFDSFLDLLKKIVIENVFTASPVEKTINDSLHLYVSKVLHNNDLQ